MVVAIENAKKKVEDLLGGNSKVSAKEIENAKKKVEELLEEKSKLLVNEVAASKEYYDKRTELGVEEEADEQIESGVEEEADEQIESGVEDEADEQIESGVENETKKIAKKIAKLRQTIENAVHKCHSASLAFLSAYSTVLYPKFSVDERMVSKGGSGGLPKDWKSPGARQAHGAHRKRVVRRLGVLGKVVVAVSEACSTMRCPFCMRMSSPGK